MKGQNPYCFACFPPLHSLIDSGHFDKPKQLHVIDLMDSTKLFIPTRVNLSVLRGCLDAAAATSNKTQFENLPHYWVRIERPPEHTVTDIYTDNLFSKRRLVYKGVGMIMDKNPAR